MNKQEARIELRLPKEVKEKFQLYAKKHNTTMSKLIYSFILFTLDKDDE